MADFVEREKIQEVISDIYKDADSAVEGACIEIWSRVKDIPAADVRQVVFCRDCKWTNTDEVEDPAIYCWKWDRWEMPPDGFCWLGKKREES